MSEATSRKHSQFYLKTQGPSRMLFNESVRERNLRLFDCETPVAMITGSASPRLGRCIASHFLHQNFRVVYHAHESNLETAALVEEFALARTAAMLVSGAVEEEAQVTRWVAQVMDAYSRVDVLVNSAAIWDPVPLEQASSADFERFFRVNTLGTALCCQHFGLAMTGQGSGGAIVNIGDWAIARPYRDFTPYFMSKGPIATLTQSMAVELASRNPRLRVNAVLPGPVKLAEGISDQKRRKIAQDCLLQREGTADDLAQAVLFLASSPFITGVCLPVDGGRSIYAGPSADSIAHPAVELDSARPSSAAS